MPASSRLLPSLLVLAVALTLAGSAHAGTIGKERRAMAGRVTGARHAVQRHPPVPEPGAPAMLGFGLALVLLRGQRPGVMPFRAP